MLTLTFDPSKTTKFTLVLHSDSCSKIVSHFRFPSRLVSILFPALFSSLIHFSIIFFSLLHSFLCSIMFSLSDSSFHFSSSHSYILTLLLQPQLNSSQMVISSSSQHKETNAVKNTPTTFSNTRLRSIGSVVSANTLLNSLLLLKSSIVRCFRKVRRQHKTRERLV
jgi:hypothetical protein